MDYVIYKQNQLQNPKYIDSCGIPLEVRIYINLHKQNTYCCQGIKTTVLLTLLPKASLLLAMIYGAKRFFKFGYCI